MKIIHTADWHLGQEFFQFDRRAEHEHFFDSLCRIVADERPDALVVSGDVYNTATPSNAAMKQFTDNMVRLHNACPEMVIVVTAGNHDSCSRLESTGEVWRLANVHVVGGVRRDGDADVFATERHIIELPGKGYILAVPFIQSNNMPIFSQLQDEVAKRNTGNLPVVMMAHLYITGSDITGHDAKVVGGMENYPLADFGTGYDYLALGHIHHPQTLKGGRARYSGSPIQINFDENYQHSVSVVELERHGVLPVIREVPIEQPMRFYTIPAKPKPFDEAIAELSAFNPERPGYVRLNLLVKDYAPSTADAVARKEVEDKNGLKFCRIIVSRMESNHSGGHLQLNTAEVREINPIELAKSFYQDSYGSSMEVELEVMLSKIIEGIKTA